MKKFIISILLFMFSANIYASDKKDICQTHKLYCAILKLQPESTFYAMALSNYIYKYSKQYDTDPYISIAIAMQESGLRNIHRSAKGLSVEWVCFGDCGWKSKEKDIYTDFGMFQFHYGALDSYNIDFTKVFEHDLEYIVKTHVKILRDKIDMCSSSYGDTAWACYHSATPKFKKKYEVMVMKYYNKIVNLSKDK
jgi:hypothetical protein